MEFGDKASGDASSTTTAAISGIAGDQAKRTGDAQTGIKPIFDKETVKQDVQAQVQITTAFGQQASKAVGDYGSKKLQEEVKLREDANKETDPTKRQAMLAEADTIHDNWKEGGSLRVLSHTLVGGLTGNLQGALGAVSTQTIVPMLGEEIAKLNMPTELKETLLQTAAIAVGGATGGSAGVAAGLNATAQNYLNHVNAEALAKLKEQQQSGKCDTACKTEITRLETLDKLTNKQLADCTGVSSSACDAVRSDVRAAAASYIRATNKPISVVYQQEQSEANSLAQSTMDGKTKGVGLGVVETVVGAGTAMYKAGVALGNIILQDPVILQQIKNAAPAVWGYVSDPENWPTMLGAMSATQREELAKAYERGDGQAVGKMMVATFASLPVGGGFGTIKKITTVADDAAIGAKVVSKSEKIIEVNVGSKSNWDKTINTDLKPNTQYKLSTGHTYVTDDVGRVNQASGDLNQTTMDRNAYQQGCVGKCVNPTGDDGGHLIASSLGGAGDRINMVPQASTLNRGDWKAMENQLRDELKAGKSVNFKVDLGYPNVTTPRPSTFKIIAIIDGKEKVWRFTQ